MKRLHRCKAAQTRCIGTTALKKHRHTSARLATPLCLRSAARLATPLGLPHRSACVPPLDLLTHTRDTSDSHASILTHTSINAHERHFGFTRTRFTRTHSWERERETSDSHASIHTNTIHTRIHTNTDSWERERDRDFRFTQRDSHTQTAFTHFEQDLDSHTDSHTHRQLRERHFGFTQRDSHTHRRHSHTSNKTSIHTQIHTQTAERERDASDSHASIHRSPLEKKRKSAIQLHNTISDI